MVFLGSFLYSIAFLGNFLVPKTIDSGPLVPRPALACRRRRAPRPLRGSAQRHGQGRLQSRLDPNRAALRGAQYLCADLEPAAGANLLEMAGHAGRDLGYYVAGAESHRLRTLRTWLVDRFTIDSYHCRDQESGALCSQVRRESVK